MKRRIFAILLTFFVTIILTSCNGLGGSNFALTEKMIDENINQLEYVESKREIIVSELPNYPVINSTYAYQGVLLVQNDDGESSVWSLITGKLFFPFKKVDDIHFYPTTYGHYVVVEYLDSEIELYDILGNLVLKKGNYLSFSVETSFGYDVDLMGDRVNAYFIEKIYSREPGMETVINTNKIDYFTGIRTEIDPTIPITTNITKSELKSFGLDGYYAHEFNGSLYIYDEDDNFVNRLHIDDSDNRYLANGKIVFQNYYEVDKEVKDYTYISNGNKYKLVTTQVDILTGKEKKLNLDYVFDSMLPIKDEKGIYKYSLGEIKYIKEKNIDSRAIRAILDENGKIIAELDIYGFHNLIKLKNYYFDIQTNFIIDKNFIPIFEVKSFEKILISEGLIVLKNNDLFGAIDENGEVVIPFKYTKIGDEFIDGKVYAIDNNGDYFLIDPKGNAEKISNEKTVTSLVTEGMFYSYETEGINGRYKAYFIDFDKKIKCQVTYTSVGLPYNISNLYGNYKLYTYLDGNKQKYIVVDVTTRKLS